MSKISIPVVSVIIPVYNDPERLKTCLQALEEQTYPKDSYEVIVVDNGSDESIESIVTEFKQARASFEAHRGSFIARNKGISLARGDVIAFIDSDCIPAPDWIERGVANLLRVPNCGIVGGKVEFFFQDSDHPTVAELYDSNWHFNQKVFIEKENFSGSGNLFTFKRVFEHVGLFAGNLNSLDDSDDKEWGQRVASFGYSLVYADDVRVAHPARYSFDQLQEKVRRVVRGNVLLDKKNGSPLFPIFNRDFLIGFMPPVFTIIRLGRNYKLSTAEKIEFMRIWFVLRWIEIREKLRVMFGGKSTA